MIRRLISKQLRQPLPPAKPEGDLYVRALPKGDLSGGRPRVVRVDGATKQALDTGRTRLLVAAMSFTLAFSLIGWRLIDLGLMAEQHEPSLARSLSSDALETGRADIVDRNGIVLATTMPTASLYANPQHVRDPEGAAESAWPAVLPEAQPGPSRAPSWPASVQLRLAAAQSDAAPAARRSTGSASPASTFQREHRRFYPHGALTAPRGRLHRRRQPGPCRHRSSPSTTCCAPPPSRCS